MKPFIQPAARWLGKRLLPRLRKREHLGWASVWILCSSCTFNHSFQDGCLGPIRITVPPTHPLARQARAKKKKNKKQPKRRGFPTLIQVQVQRAKGGTARRHRATTHEPPMRQLLASSMVVSALDEHPPQRQLLPSPSVFQTQWPPRAYEARLPGVMQLLFWRDGESPLRPEPPPSKRPDTLYNAELRETWKERPVQIELCFHLETPNDGWTHYHLPRSTAQREKRCQKGYPLGIGAYWYLLSDTFAASAMPCRLFFSPGRVYVVAQCGATIYRGKISTFARCLQTGEGPSCRYPHATLTKLPPEQAQTVEKIH